MKTNLKEGKVKSTNLYYRIDMRSGIAILNRKPKTKEEVDKLSLPEREAWTQFAGVEDKDMNAYQKHFGKV
jgi:hypothetical protein